MAEETQRESCTHCGATYDAGELHMCRDEQDGEITPCSDIELADGECPW